MLEANIGLVNAVQLKRTSTMGCQPGKVSSHL